MYQELQKGWIEVITGPMFAGKSQELIRRITTLSFAKKSIVAFKPRIDNRYDESRIASHDGEKYEAHAITSPLEMLAFVKPGTEVVGVDEAQFFDRSLIDILESFASRGIRVIAAGLDLDFRGEPFAIMPELLARAEFITKLEAVCTICGCGATRTQRIIEGRPAHFDDPVVLVGAKESYEARCRKHHLVPGKPLDKA